MKVLVPFDGSRSARVGLQHAIAAQRGVAGSEIHVLNVQPRMRRHSARFLSAADISAALAARARPPLADAQREVEATGIRCVSAVRVGDPAMEIDRYAAEHGISRVIVGAARKSALHRLLTGSIADGVLEHSRVPVELVPGERPGALARYALPAGVGVGLTALMVAVD